MSISEIWSNLYSNNPKLQAFAVSDDSKIIWQTDNWNLVDAIEEIMDICCNKKPNVKVAGISYKSIQSTDDTFIATSDKKGHFLMAKANHLNDTWIMAWATSDSDPELAIIDLMYAATKMPSF